MLGRQGLAVLDPTTGRRLHADPTVSAAAQVGCTFLTVSRAQGSLLLRELDRANGWQVIAEGGFSDSPLAPGEVATFLCPEGLPPIAVADPARGPLRWGECTAVAQRDATGALLTAEHMVIERHGQVVVLDRASGQTRTALHGEGRVLARSNGIAYRPMGSSAIAVADPNTGADRCVLMHEAGVPPEVRSLVAEPIALSPDHLVAVQRRRGGLVRVVMDLRTSRLAVLGHDAGLLVMAREVIYTTGHSRDHLLVARRTTGETLWTLSGKLHALAPIPAGLIGLELGKPSRVVCWSS